MVAPHRAPTVSSTPAPLTLAAPTKPWLPRKILRRVLHPLRSQEPAAQLIRHTARQQWRLLVVNLVCSLLQAFSEGATLGVVFLAVEVLSAPAAEPFNWASNPILGRLPGAVALLSSVPASGAFMLRLPLESTKTTI